MDAKVWLKLMLDTALAPVSLTEIPIRSSYAHTLFKPDWTLEQALS